MVQRELESVWATCDGIPRDRGGVEERFGSCLAGVSLPAQHENLRPVSPRASTDDELRAAMRRVMTVHGRLLSPRLRAVVVTRLLGLSGKEAADVLAIELTTLQGYLREVRDRLGWTSLDVLASAVLRELGVDIDRLIAEVVEDDEVARRLSRSHQSMRPQPRRPALATPRARLPTGPEENDGWKAWG